MPAHELLRSLRLSHPYFRGLLLHPAPLLSQLAHQWTARYFVVAEPATRWDGLIAYASFRPSEGSGVPLFAQSTLGVSLGVLKAVWFLC